MYGYLHQGRITSFDAVSGGWFLQSVGLARTSRWGPVPSAVPGLAEGDRVVLGATGTTRDNLVIIAKVGATFPAISDIPGLVAALAGKADDSEITALDGRVDALESGAATLDGRVDTLESGAVSLDGRVDTLEAGAVSLDGRLDTLEALNHVRVVSDLDDISTPFSNQLAWLTTDRSFYRWDSAATPHRWSKSAVSGQVIGGKRRIADASATSGSTELNVLNTGALDFEVYSTYEIKATLLWSSSNSGNDFVVAIKETDTAGTQRASLVVPRTDGNYPYQTVITYLKVTGLREDALSHIVSVQRAVGTGTCTVFANSFMTATYLGSGDLLGDLS